MRMHSVFQRLIAVLSILAILLSCPFAPVSAEAAETGNKVTASTSASVKQGNSAYCYVYIDSLESLSTLEVTVHFDPAVVSVTGSYNQVSTQLYDSAATESTLQYTYIFDGNGANEKTQLFYFQYTVLADAPVGETYFDVVVGDAYDSSFSTLPIGGSRCRFSVSQAVTDLYCHVYGTSSVNTSVDREFSVTYQFSTADIASGAAVIRYDPELFVLLGVEQGSFLEEKLVDMNTSLAGAVYVSFLGSDYSAGTDFLTLRLRTVKNTAQTSNITLALTDLYDLELNSIICSGYQTAVRVSDDPTYDETAPRVYLQNDYDPETQKLIVRVCLEENSHLGAGDFVLGFDTTRLAFVSAQKAYSPTFFNINDKETGEGKLKFSVISLADQTAAATMLEAIFDVITPCENAESAMMITGSGLADHLTNTIVLNFAGTTVITSGHTLVTDAAVAPTCLDTGLTEGNHCAVCQKVLLAQQIMDALGHDEIPHEAAAPTCTGIGWDAYVTCSRCDYTTYNEIPANGHTFGQGVCTVCAAAQEAQQSWDISAAADGSLIAQLYLNHDGSYDLQITGSGAMQDWSDSYSVPWHSYRSELTGIRLPEGLTYVGAFAFRDCKGLVDVELPGSIAHIGRYAFSGCANIRLQAWPESLQTVDDSAFSGCKALTELDLPEGLQTIGNYGFSGCTSLTELTLPESLQSLGNYAFQGCTGLKRIQFNAAQLADLKARNYTFAYAGNAGDGIQVTFGSNVTRVPAYLFYPQYAVTYRPNIKTVTFAQGSLCESIGTCAFYNCTSLTELMLPESLQDMGSCAFYNCGSLASIDFRATQMTDLSSDNRVFECCGNLADGTTVTFSSNVTRVPAYLFYLYGNSNSIKTVVFAENSTCQSIGTYAFANCTELCGLDLPQSITSIESYAFDHCAGLMELNLPEGLLSVGFAAFQNCTGVQSLTLPEGLQTVGDYAFYNCTGLTQIRFNATKMADTDEGNYIFIDAGLNGDGIAVTVGSNVTRIPSYLFSGVKLCAVTFEDSSACQSIGSHAFYGCINLTAINLPSSITEIEALAFNGCTGLTELDLPENLQTIENSAFYSCTGLTEVTWPAGLQTIGDYAFQYCTGLTELSLPENLQSIGYSAFYECTGLRSVTLPEDLQSLGNYAFYNCTGLTQIRFNAVQMADLSDNNYVFACCGSEADGITVTVGSSVARIPSYLFSGLKLCAVTFEDSSACQSIGSFAFYNCKNLTAIHLPSGITNIEKYAFYGCTDIVIGFASSALPETLGSGWHNSEVSYYLNVRQIVDLGDACYLITGDDTAILGKYYGTATEYRVLSEVNGAVVRTIGTNAFRNHTVITQVEIPESVTAIQNSAFYGCTALQTITIPRSITSIGNRAFYNCTNVETIAFNAVSMEDLRYENYVFYRCGHDAEGISVTIGGEVTKIPAYLFRSAHDDSYNPRITCIDFAEGGVCQSIGYCAFYGQDHLATLVVPASVTTISGHAMSYCAKLTIGLEATELPTVEAYWSSGCGYYLNVKEFAVYDDAVYVITNDNTAALGRYFGTDTRYEVLPEVNGVVVTQIGDYAFYNMRTQEYVTIPDTVERIGAYAFYYNRAMTQLCLPANLQTIGEKAFYSCTNIPSVLLPESVTDIGSYAFSGCDKLTVGFAGEASSVVQDDGWDPGCGYYENVAEFADLEDATYAILKNSTAVLAKFYGTQTHYDILDSINGTGVVSVGWYAFQNNTTLTGVTIPDTVTRLEASAFYACTSLETVHMSQNLTYIGDSAFAYCTKLQSITIPQGVRIIQYGAFSETYALTELRLEAEALDDVGSYNSIFALSGKDGDGIRLTVGAQVTRIPDYFFYPESDSYNPKITEVVFEDGSVCKIIGAYNFCGNTGLTGIRLPESLEMIGAYAFSGTYFASIELPDAVTSIGNYAFSNCPNLAAVRMPEALTTIGKRAFAGCSALTQIVIPENVTTIDSYAFEGTALKLVYIDSGTVAYQASSATACGRLLNGVTAIMIRSDVGRVSDYITQNYPNTTTITCRDVDYVSYNTGEHTWTEYEVLVPFVACQQDGCIRYLCGSCGAFKDVTTFRHDVIVNGAKDPDCLNVGWYEYHTCSRCDYSTYEERPALGHRVMVDGSIWVDPITVQNDAVYPFYCDNGTYTSVNQTDNTDSYFTITALYDCTLELSYAVSSEANYDKIIIRKNGSVQDEISGQVDWKTQTLALTAGDVVTVNYHKDVSASYGEDTGWFRYTCPQTNVGADVPGPAEDAEPTCTEPVVCYYCQTLIKEALGHAPIRHEAQTVTCLEIGWDAYETCSRCDYTTYVEISALGHDAIRHDAQAVTCLEIGWDAYETCSRCDHTTYADIPALGHDYIDHEARAETCTEIGWNAYQTCGRCDYTTYLEIPVLGHNPVYSETQQPTCLNIGYDIYQCTRCDYTTSTEIPALGHDPIQHDARAATCLEIGWDAFETCSRCDHTTYVEIPATGHGFMDKVCIVCGAGQAPTKQWDLSEDGDGTVMAYAYMHMDGTYLLEIRGNGPVKDCSSSPFKYSLSGMIDDIYIGDGVTALGNRLFSSVSIRGQIQIADSVTSVGDYTFYGFSGPRTVTLPAGIVSIGNFAFYEADNMTIILLGDQMPAYTGSIWDYNCGHYLQPQQVINTENAIYIIDRDGKAWLAKYLLNEKEFVAETAVAGIPVTGIGAYAFDSKTQMITYTVPEEITVIGQNAFAGCSNLTVLLESEAYPYGFSGGAYDGPPCYLAPQKVILLEDRLYVQANDGQMYFARYLGNADHVTVESEIDGQPVRHIGDFAFGHRYMQTVTLPDTVETIGAYAFIHSAVKQIELPESLTAIRTWGFFGADLTSITIPKNVTVIEWATYSYCDHLKAVYVLSETIAKQLNSTDACGSLCEYAQTVVVPAAVENNWLSETFSYQETVQMQNMDCVIYSNCVHEWQEERLSEWVPCQTDGVIAHTCTACGVKKTQITPSHDEIAHGGQAATCTAIGWEAYTTCSRCEYSTYVEIPATGNHSYNSVVKEPTCSAQGYITHTCTVCGHVLVDSYTAPLDHTFRDYYCTECGAEDPMNPMDLNDDGKITAFDAQILAEAKRGKRILTEQQWALLGDLGPGDILACVLRAAVKKVILEKLPALLPTENPLEDWSVAAFFSEASDNETDKQQKYSDHTQINADSNMVEILWELGEDDRTDSRIDTIGLQLMNSTGTAESATVTVLQIKYYTAADGGYEEHILNHSQREIEAVLHDGVLTAEILKLDPSLDISNAVAIYVKAVIVPVASAPEETPETSPEPEVPAPEESIPGEPAPEDSDTGDAAPEEVLSPDNAVSTDLTATATSLQQT